MAQKVLFKFDPNLTPVCYSDLFTIFPNVITNTGIKTICTIIPGTALSTAPAKNAFKPNFEASNPMQQNIIMPHTSRPITIAPNKDTYTYWLPYKDTTAEKEMQVFFQKICITEVKFHKLPLSEKVFDAFATYFRYAVWVFQTAFTKNGKAFVAFPFFMIAT